MEKHHNEKMSSNLTFDDLVEIRYKYDITPHEGMILVPHHLCDADNPPVGWWVTHWASFKIGLQNPFPKMVVHAFINFNINLVKYNPNGWKNLLCLSIITGKQGGLDKR